ncbi:uncharacterized protein DUF222 [Catellatospora citrea]|nr:uncharacterized protein DUF222 [Catellatospora citrea]
MREALAQAERTVAACTDAPVWPLADAELITALDAAHRLRERLSGVELSLVRELDARAVPTAHGASSTAVWLREHWRVGIRTAKQTVELARSLDRLPATAEALTAGAVNTEQAAVIAQALAELPALAGLETAAKAEAALIGFAAQFEPSVLRRFGERILTHVAPDLAEEHEREALAEHEERAHAARTLTLTPDRSGRVRLTGWLDTEAAAVVTAALDPLTRPGVGPARPPVLTGDGIPDDTRTDDGSRTAGHYAPEKTHDMRTAGQRRADALTEICRRVLASGELPDNGGDRPQLVITVDYDDLARRTGAGLLDNGATLTPDTVRRIACDAQVIPAVLGGDGQLLDLGRTRRLITGPCAERSSSATAGAPSLAATARHAGARGTTSGTGRTAAPPTSTTPSCSAGTTIASSTTKTGTSASATTDDRSSSRRATWTPPGVRAATPTTCGPSPYPRIDHPRPSRKSAVTSLPRRHTGFRLGTCGQTTSVAARAASPTPTSSTIALAAYGPARRSRRNRSNRPAQRSRTLSSSSPAAVSVPAMPRP